MIYFVRIAHSVFLIGAVAVIMTGAWSALSVSTTGLSNTVFASAMAELKLLKNPALPATATNITNQFSKLTFSNIYPGWQGRIGFKLVNLGDIPLSIALRASYEKGKQPLANHITITMRQWNDKNSNGIVETGEIQTTLGSKSLAQLMDGDTIRLTTIPAHKKTITGYVFDATCDKSLGNEWQDKKIISSFIFQGSS